MIGWHITLGYNSGCTAHKGNAEWEDVKAYAFAVAEIPELANEAMKSAPVSLQTKILEVTDTYQSETGNPYPNPLHICDDKIMIFASGGGDYRAAKEHVARAFVRILMRAVHERGFDINVSVV